MVQLRGKGVLFGVAVILAVAALQVPAAAQSKRAKPAPVNVATEAEALAKGDVDRAVQAAQKLGASRNPKALDPLLDALALGHHPKVVAAALEAVARFGDARAFGVVSTYLSHRDRRARAAAVTAVGSIDDKRAVTAVLAALRDQRKEVRAAAVEVVKNRKLATGIEPMMKLLEKGDEAPAAALAALADPDLALSLGELIGEAPDAVLARALGLILLRPDFKPEAARVQVVRTIAKIPGTEAVEQLTTYLESIPEKPPRQSRREAEAIIEQRLTGGN